jgi:TRAP-type uncharacterized transport system substrate-binding protein
LLRWNSNDSSDREVDDEDQSQGCSAGWVRRDAWRFAGSDAARRYVFFRIGTGGTIGTYYPVGGLIANAISNPPGSRTCADGGSCGVPNLIGTAVATDGSVSNVAGIAGGRMAPRCRQRLP